MLNQAKKRDMRDVFHQIAAKITLINLILPKLTREVKKLFPTQNRFPPQTNQQSVLSLFARQLFDCFEIQTIPQVFVSINDSHHRYFQDHFFVFAFILVFSFIIILFFEYYCFTKSICMLHNILLYLHLRNHIMYRIRRSSLRLRHR